MTAIPLHIKRRFEQRWASRFTTPDTPALPQKHQYKIALSLKMERTPKKQPARNRVGTVHGVGG